MDICWNDTSDKIAPRKRHQTKKDMDFKSFIKEKK